MKDPSFLMYFPIQHGGISVAIELLSSNARTSPGGDSLHRICRWTVFRWKISGVNSQHRSRTRILWIRWNTSFSWHPQLAPENERPKVKVSNMSFWLQLRVLKKKARQFSMSMFSMPTHGQTSELIFSMVVQVLDGIFEHQINQTISGSLTARSVPS